MAASIIPPPIVQSSYAASPSRAPHRSAILEQPSQVVDDRQAELEADLQFLLNAQEEGLMKAVEGGLADEHSSTGSTTPTVASVRSASARRKARPIRKKPGLRSVRKGIYNSFLALSAYKQEELRAIDAEAKEKDDTLARIDEWEQKRQGLQEATRHVDDSEETVRAQRLRQQADVLQEEINAVEIQLSDLKARHRKLVKHAAAAENAVQAKLASYTHSLSMLDADVQKFLSLESAERESAPPADGRTSIWQLPPKRRTLEMAREQWTEDKNAILGQRLNIEEEKSALDQGATIWQDVVSRVVDFEKRLRADVAELSSSQSAWEDPPPPSQDSGERLGQLLQHLDGVVSHLEARHKLAEERHWAPLIAAIGAELYALQEGRKILSNLLPAASTSPTELLQGEAQHGSPGGVGENTKDRNGIHKLDKSFETARRPQRASSDSDDPDPELLFSRQDIERV